MPGDKALSELSKWWEEQRKQAEENTIDLSDGKVRLGCGILGIASGGYLFFQGGRLSKEKGAWWKGRPLSCFAMATVLMGLSSLHLMSTYVLMTEPEVKRDSKGTTELSQTQSNIDR
ncbi:uncharacterized protein [Amphiura filiformis]|uniref:uncharacterized protein n=1 Tax=Amphiura filiformis TaxID=82378 RepID=UPI003B21B05E